MWNVAQRRTKTNHHGGESSSHELPVNKDHPAPLQSGKIIGVSSFLCQLEGERLSPMGSSHGLAFFPNHRDRPHVSVGL